MNSSSNSEDGAITSAEMIERSSSWTLGCDNALLNRLKSISKNLERNAEEISRECESLSRDVSVLQSSLFNVTNQFLMVSNSQFVENRVQEFEEASDCQSTSGEFNSFNKISLKTKAEKEAELISKMKDAIQIGVSTQEEQSSLSPDQNHSFNLCVPHLIGTSKFFSSKFVGLVDSTERVSSQPFLPNPVSTPESDLTESNQIISLQTNKTNLKSDNNSLPNESKSDVEANAIPYPSSSLQSTISGKPTAASDQPVIIPPASLHKPQIYQYAGQNLDGYDSPICPPPPCYTDQSDDSDDDFKIPSTGGPRLFSDDDDDLFNDSSLFVSKPDENLFFGVQNATLNPTQPTTLIEPPPFEGVQDRSRASNVSRTSDIGHTPENDKNSAPSPLPVQPKDSHFSHRENLPHSQQGENISRSKIPPGGVSVFGSVPPAEIPRLKHQLSSQSKKIGSKESGNAPSITVQDSIVSASGPSNNKTNEDNIVSHSSQTSKKGINGSRGLLHEPNNIVTRPNNAHNGLFNDESDDDIFSSDTKDAVKSNTKGNTTLFSKSISSDSRSSSNNLSKANVANLRGVQQPNFKVKSSIFDDSESEDDLFSSASSTTSSKAKDKMTSLSYSERNKNISENLFGEDSDVDLFANVVSTDNKSSKTNDRTASTNKELSSDEHNEKVVDEPRTEVAVEDVKPNMNILVDKELNHEDIPKESSQPEFIDYVSHLHEDSITDSDANRDSKIQPQNSLTTTEPPQSATSVSRSDSSTPALGESKVKTIIDEKNQNPSDSIKISETTVAKTQNKKVMGKKAIFEGQKELTDDHQIKASQKIKTNISVKALGSGLNLNLSAMRPGAKAPKLGSIDKSDSIVSSSAETPSEASTPESSIRTFTREDSPMDNSFCRISPDKVISCPLLSNLSKGRVKIQVKRKPPSKKLLRSYITAKEEEIKSETEETEEIHSEKEDKAVTTAPEETLEESEKHPKSTSSEIIADMISPSTDEEDIFPIPDSVLTTDGSLPNQQEEQPEESVSHNIPTEGMSEYKDDFDTVPSKSTTENILAKKRVFLWEDSDSDDIFATSSDKPEKQTKGKDLFSTSKSLINDTIDSLPSNPEKSVSATVSNNAQQADAKSSIVKAIAEDIYSTQISATENAKKSASSQKGRNLFLDDDDDDITEEPAKPVSSVTLRSDYTGENVTTAPDTISSKVQSSITKKPKKGLFDSDSDGSNSDDLFHSSSKPKNDYAPSTKDVSKSKENSNSVNSKSKSKKGTVKTGRKKPSAQTAIFNDSSDDDLFGSAKSTNKKNSAIA